LVVNGTKRHFVAAQQMVAFGGKSGHCVAASVAAKKRREKIISHARKNFLAGLRNPHPLSLD
jgi:hypothetical protein